MKVDMPVNKEIKQNQGVFKKYPDRSFIYEDKNEQ